MDQEPQGMRYPKVLPLSLLVIFIGAFGYYFYVSYEQPVNHLIEGVPYYGVYNLYPDFTSAATSIATVLRYYNDERVSFNDLKNKFPDLRYDKDDISNFQNAFNFFEAQGYDAFSIRLLNAKYTDRKINEIKKFIKKDIPVIINQQKRLDTKSDDIERFGWRVVIGVFDNEKKIIVHDVALGNNYELSFDDFERLFVPDASRMLAVWPKNDLAQSLPKPGNGTQYPERSPIMENAYEIIGAAGRARAAVATADAVCSNMSDNPTPEQINEFVRLNKESIKYRDEVINNPIFKDMPAYFQFRNKFYRARSLMRIGEVSRAREILINELIPTNKNLDESVEGFEPASDFSEVSDDSARYAKVINGQMPAVYEVLMNSYRYEGKYKEAINAYLPYFEIYPDDKYALKKLEQVRDELSDPSSRKPLKGVVCIGGQGVIK
ncbi:MAG: C39 family peptidase [Patescibacteria group bacterium]